MLPSVISPAAAPIPERYGRHGRGMLTVGRALGRYFRFELEGLDRLPRDRSCLVALYHGTGIPLHLWCMVPRLVDELGYFPLTVVLQALRHVPVLNRCLVELGATFGEPDERAVGELVARARHAIVCPGGVREGARPFWRRYTVDWGDRTGYLRLAARHGLAIVPAAADGVDDVYLGLNDGYRTCKRLLGHGALPLYLAIGIGGLWPLALPFPVRIRQRLGRPIELAELGLTRGENDAASLGRAQARVTREVQLLLDELRDRRRP
jgi:1-acyl-sn-glycerol-3-phosphate acyltransferase